jgi:iron(III) transport system ATP-binding protein
MRVLAAVRLDQFAERDATKLSGGQQQRLALARALVMEPQLLLLDEPLSNLDAKLREAMRFELLRLQRELSLTTVYVTHDQAEALALSHQIAVMNEGRIIQIGSPRDIYERPKNRFVADFVGTTNFLDGTVLSNGNGRCQVSTRFGAIDVQCVEALASNAAVVISVRPEDIELSEQAPARTDGFNVLSGTVAAKAFQGEFQDFQVRVGDSVLLARAHPSLHTPLGGPIHMRMKAEKCVAVPG